MYKESDSTLCVVHEPKLGRAVGFSTRASRVGVGFYTTLLYCVGFYTTVGFYKSLLMDDRSCEKLCRKYMIMSVCTPSSPSNTCLDKEKKYFVDLF